MRLRAFGKSKSRTQAGVLLIEIVLAVAIFGMISLIVVSAFTYGRESTTVGGDNSRGAQVANAAVEALHNIVQSSYSNLNSYTNGTTYYLNTTGTQWTLQTTPVTTNSIYTVQVVFGNGPSNSRQATVTVTWKATAQRQGTITTTTYLSNWTTATSQTVKTGLLVYANGGTTSNLITYRLLQSNGLWTNPLALPTAGASNYVARSVKLYPAQTGANKMVLARFYDGTKQYLYAYYWNGNSWATPKLLASWTSSSALDSGNFSGTWLANNTFIGIYSDNTNKPKYNTYNNGTWSAQGALGAISGTSSDSPTSMIIQARPNSNEAMLGLLGENYQTLTAYYANAAWSGYTTQASNGTSNGTHNVDFAWSEAGGGLYGALVFTRGSTDRTPSIRIFTADGSGGGSWGTVMTGTNQPTGSIPISMAIAGQVSGSVNFIICDKDSQAAPKVYCYTATTTAVTSPTNQLLANPTASGGQQSMELGFEDAVGTTGLAAYADNTSSGKLKRFLSATNTWDASPLALPVSASAIEKTKLLPEPGQNDAMVLVIDTQNNLYSNMYNGNNHTFYTSPSGYNWTIHNANGPSTAAKWFDFGWDN